MALEIEIINAGDVTVDTSFLAKHRTPGTPAAVCVNAFLIRGLSAGPVLVDTGFRSTEIMTTVGMVATDAPAGTLEAQLEIRGIKPGDVAMIIHTHLHIDHAGKDDLFPDSTRVVTSRRELEIGCNGSGGGGYPAPDMKHLLGRVWRQDAIQLLDAEDGDVIEVLPGLAVERSGGHTEGSLSVLVETRDGLARICGDVFYNLEHQLGNPFDEVLFNEPHISGNTAMSERQERRAMKRAVRGCKWLLPSHDAPGRLERGRLVARVGGDMVPPRP
ncbi:MBL fold metallo-hydrolase [Bradyrhizobium prioriisuperbiae]|uniref:MBL fold metallo-hydrolase n=1 Tax=Bradyrhizobium prioriisuperbiae TaxID=2854389 RepID=UPI0028E51BB1|nr:MBL fold metallo-hydrolase [Bradyrhizobium prioritasuperba]